MILTISNKDLENDRIMFLKSFSQTVIILATAAMMVFGLWGTLSLTQVRDLIVKYDVVSDGNDTLHKVSAILCLILKIWCCQLFSLL